MKPYYEDELVTLYHADCAEVLAGLPDGAGVVVTDPPYSARTHEKSRSNRETPADARTNNPIGFRHVDDTELADTLSECARVSTGWVVSFMDYAQAARFDAVPPEGLRMMRVGAWVKTNPMPQLTGDRPAQGWEAIAYMHTRGRASWNGGGKHGNFVTKTVQRSGHPTAKPESIVRQFIEWFSEPGDTIIDPFAGSGTTLVAARDTGRRAIGCELDEKYCKLIVDRLSQQVIPL